MNVTIQSLVFSLPQRQYIRAGRNKLEAATLNLKDIRERVALDASMAYVELDTVNQELAATEDQISYTTRLVEIQQERSEAGIDSVDDLLQAQLTAAEIDLRCLHLKTRAATIAQELASLTGLPVGSIVPDHTSIPEIPEIHGRELERASAGIESVQLLARSKQRIAQGDRLSTLRPQISLTAHYNRDTKLLNNADYYFAHPLKPDNISSGFNIQVPLFDLAQRARARQSAADALRATVEAEQVQQDNDLQMVQLTADLREKDALSRIACLKREIAKRQLDAVLVQLEMGNGEGSGPGAKPQLTPKAEQLARIEERQRFQELLEAGLNLSKTRLALLHALGHMEDWLHKPQT
jgi:outer membrane protein TolC